MADVALPGHGDAVVGVHIDEEEYEEAVCRHRYSIANEYRSRAVRFLSFFDTHSYSNWRWRTQLLIFCRLTTTLEHSR